MKDLIKALKDFIGYIIEERKWWLVPVAVALFLLGFVIATAGNSPVPVFVYPMA